MRVLGTRQTLFRLQPTRLVSGRLWSPHEERTGATVAVLGRTIVDSLFGGRIPAQVRLGSTTVQVVGVVQSGAVAPIELDRLIVMPVRVHRAITDAVDGVASLLAVDHQDANGPSTRAQLVRTRHRAPRDFAAVTVSTTRDRLGDVARLEDALRHGARILSWVMSMASVVAVTALSASIARAHRRTVGVVRALGATRGIVIAQGAAIGMLLGAAGALAGWLVAMPVMYLLPAVLDTAVLPVESIVSAMLHGALPSVTVAGTVCTALFARLARKTPAALL
jgi:putative ABC transport system permease protein